MATAPYAPDAAGVLRPCVLPLACVVEDASADVCRIGVDHRRERKTGPCFPVVVLTCHTHRRGFTLYPLGHVPYGRVAIAPVAADGEPVWCATSGGERRLAWRTTLFQAAVDAAAGHAWARENAVHGALWETQLDHLETAAALLGLGPRPEPRLGEMLAARLAVPRLALLEATRDFERASGFEDRGLAVCAVLARLPPGPCIASRLLACGALVGRWGRVTRWDPGRSGARSVVFLPQREAPS